MKYDSSTSTGLIFQGFEKHAGTICIQGKEPSFGVALDGQWNGMLKVEVLTMG